MSGNGGPTIIVSEGVLSNGDTEQHAGASRTTHLAGEQRIGLARNTNAAITFRNGMKMELGLEADMTFEKGPGEPVNASRRVHLNSGRLLADVPASADAFTVETPQCTAAISGARVEVVTNAVATQVRVATGKARVERRSDHAQVEIGEGQYAVVRDDLKPAARPVVPVRCLFDDQPDAMSFWTAEAGSHAIVQEDSRSGSASLRITPRQGRVTLSGLALPIREHPGPGEYRFVAFAWRKDGGGRIALQFDHADEATDRRKQGQMYGYRFDAGDGPKVDGASLRIDGRTPAAWWLLTRDLWQDFGDFTLTGLTFICPDGDSAWFDTVYVAHTPADLTAVADAGPDPRQQLPSEPQLANPADLRQIEFVPRPFKGLQAHWHE
jgi:hypothetical protein